MGRFLVEDGVSDGHGGKRVGAAIFVGRARSEWCRFGSRTPSPGPFAARYSEDAHEGRTL